MTCRRSAQDTTPDADVEKTLRMVALRETEHGIAFEKRINELGYELRRPEEAKENPLLALVSDPDVSDMEKIEKAGFGGDAPDASKPDHRIFNPGHFNWIRR